MKKILKNLKNKNKKENKLEFLEGSRSVKDKISPSYIITKNPKYIEIENMLYSSLLIIDYYREQSEILLKELIDSNINMNLSIFYEKKDSYKIIRELTYHIGNVGVSLKNGEKNNHEIDIAAFTYNDAKYIRKEMQVNNEELYFLYIYITIYSENEKELEYILNKVEGILQSKGMRHKKSIF